MTSLKLAVSAALLASAGTSTAAMMDCAALSNSAGIEPIGHAAYCGTPRDADPFHVTDWRVPTDTGWLVDIRGGAAPRVANTVYTFALNNFPTQTPIGVTQPSVFAMEFSIDGGTLYAATGSAASPNPSTLGTINQATGAFTPIGPLTGLTAGDSVTGVVIDQTTGIAYLSAAGGAPALSRLYTLNLATGAVTLIGQMTAPTDAAGTFMIDIAINCSSQMYAHNISDDALYTINLATGAGTFIGGHGLAANFAQGMDFDKSDGTLYAWIYTGGGTNRHGTFDLATGAFTTLTQDNPLGEYEGAIPTRCVPPPDDLFADGFEDAPPT